MKSRTYFSVAPYCVAVVLLSLPGVFAAEHKLSRNALPDAVKKTIDAETAGSTIKGYASEHEDGKKVYEAETTKNGRTRDLQIAEDGTLNEVEEEVPFSELPANVQQGLKTKAAAAEITKVESLTKKGKLVAYEAAVRSGIHRGEIQVGPEGQTLSHEE